ncbi:Endonuclease/exonuclease/phosphatase [Corchorus olitorius]|uniref:Endonuclease/exonuclease/phosphatase n=1 Tax=Corchorus olitorius TaxID=93759 RepID=A0A1R3KPU6_9ROSI|nr:Endonuclease/exonuclease/phosphatase [Corchorus olitorius]
MAANIHATQLQKRARSSQDGETEPGSDAQGKQVEVPSKQDPKGRFFKDACVGKGLSWQEVIGQLDFESLSLDQECDDGTSWPALTLTKEQFKKICEPWHKTLLVKILGKMMGFNFLQQWLKQLWNFDKGFSLVDLGNDFYLVKTSEAKQTREASRSAEDGPWMTVQRRKGTSPGNKGQAKSPSPHQEKASRSRFTPLHMEEHGKPTNGKENTLALKEDFDRVFKVVKNIPNPTQSHASSAQRQDNGKAKALQEITNQCHHPASRPGPATIPTHCVSKCNRSPSQPPPEVLEMMVTLPPGMLNVMDQMIWKEFVDSMDADLTNNPSLMKILLWNVRGAGGIWLLWNDKEVDVQIDNSMFQAVTISVKQNNNEWNFTTVYGSPAPTNREELWTYLGDESQNIQGPWLVGGDFNSISSSAEKSNFSSQDTNGCRRFNEVINQCELMDLGFMGPRYTWKRVCYGLGKT